MVSDISVASVSCDLISFATHTRKKQVSDSEGLVPYLR